LVEQNAVCPVDLPTTTSRYCKLVTTCQSQQEVETYTVTTCQVGLVGSNQVGSDDTVTTCQLQQVETDTVTICQLQQ